MLALLFTTHCCGVCVKFEAVPTCARLGDVLTPLIASPLTPTTEFGALVTLALSLRSPLSGIVQHVEPSLSSSTKKQYLRYYRLVRVRSRLIASCTTRATRGLAGSRS